MAQVFLPQQISDRGMDANLRELIPYIVLVLKGSNPSA